MKKWILVLIMIMSTIIPAKAAYQDKSKFKTAFTIRNIDKPDDNRTFRKDGTKWLMSGTWVRVKIKNNLKKETAFKAELSVYNRNKELVKTFSEYNINPQDSKYFDESEGAVQGKKSISIFFKIPNNYETNHFSALLHCSSGMCRGHLFTKYQINTGPWGNDYRTGIEGD